MRAIIIAAGKGTRLYPLTKDTPKSLLEVGAGLTLLDVQLHSLKENGIRDVTVIVGYKAELIEAKISQYRDGFNISTVFNPFFDCSNNLISVWLARHCFEDEFITINGDDLFLPVVIENLLKSRHDITMVIDEKESYDEDDMKVVHSGGLIREVSKTVPTRDANGESIGIIKFSGDGPKLYQTVLEEMVRVPENRDVFYLKAIQEMIRRRHPVHYSVCTTTDWGELDFHPDLLLIRQYVSQQKLVEKILVEKKGS